MRLINTVYSYAATTAMSVTSDRDVMPCPAAYADALESVFRALKR